MASAAAVALSCENFDIVSVITEDIYLKLRLVVHYHMGNPNLIGEVILNFFYIVMPLFCLRNINAAAAERWHQHAYISQTIQGTCLIFGMAFPRA